MNAIEAKKIADSYNIRKSTQQYQDVKSLINTTSIKGLYSIKIANIRLFPSVKEKLVQEGYRCVDISESSTQIYWT